VYSACKWNDIDTEREKKRGREKCHTAYYTVADSMQRTCTGDAKRKTKRRQTHLRRIY